MILSLDLPTEKGTENYHALLDYQNSPNPQVTERKAQEQITNQIFNQH
jgi:hypothetical protein